ncbi:hypothetical protein [Aquisphaera insulae]|uniref:hypothetical protein n=1 Tax=Aquisphaera insulae TaxID=2712864 RepID=UPI0013E9D04D|nr:hypothetical protein [Aquisphaera insulae]
MNPMDRWRFRVGILTELVARSQVKLGRTALMKLAYLLQAIEGVPLGYDFRMYTYGPFDEDLLNDLGQAESLRAVVSSMIPFERGGGYGYEFTRGPDADLVRKPVAGKIARYVKSLSWVLESFGHRSAAELELLSTIVHADRHWLGRGERVFLDDFVKKIKDIKPRFSDDQIKRSIDELQKMKMLKALDSRSLSLPTS